MEGGAGILTEPSNGLVEDMVKRKGRKKGILIGKCDEPRSQ